MKRKLLALAVVFAVPLSTFASDGDITFNGKVTASACTLKGIDGGTESTGAIVTLSDVTPTSFSNAGGYAGMKDFTIDLKDCDITTIKNASVSFIGTPDSLDSEILKNAAGTSPADGVGIAILENDGATKVSINGGDVSKKQALSQGDTSLKFKVAYKANAATPAVTAGNVSAKTFFDITYQ